MDERQISIGVFIDGGYYAKIDENLKDLAGLQVDLNDLFNYIRTQVSTKYELDFAD